MSKFWNWKETKNDNDEVMSRTLYIEGTIAEESWYDDDLTPQMFKDELNAGSGDITVWINSPGGDCIAASQIYTMLIDYKGNVNVKIDGMAASAASVIAMAGTTVAMSPTAMMMIHNPMTVVSGDHNEMEKAIDMLAEVKESIINAYELKTGMQRAKLSRLMENETWMNAKVALDYGFIDEILTRDECVEPSAIQAFTFSQIKLTNNLIEKITKKCAIEQASQSDDIEANDSLPEVKIQSSILLERLNKIMNKEESEE